MYDPNTTTVYSNNAGNTFVVPSNNSGVADLTTFGGINTGTAGVNPASATFNKYYSGYVKDIRFYKKSVVSAPSSNTWTNEVSAYRNYYDTGDVPNVNWAWGGQPNATRTPTVAMSPINPYVNLGLPRPTDNVNIVFERDTLSQSLLPYNPDITCIYAPS